MTIHVRINKHTVVYPPTGVPLRNKRELTNDTLTTWINFKNIILRARY